nr:hypothetical protein Iba_chr12bCG1060 [Ipomoea batatas]
MISIKLPSLSEAAALSEFVESPTIANETSQAASLQSKSAFRNNLARRGRKAEALRRISEPFDSRKDANSVSTVSAAIRSYKPLVSLKHTSRKGRCLKASPRANKGNHPLKVHDSLKYCSNNKSRNSSTEFNSEIMGFRRELKLRTRSSSRGEVETLPFDATMAAQRCITADNASGIRSAATRTFSYLNRSIAEGLEAFARLSARFLIEETTRSIDKDSERTSGTLSLSTPATSRGPFFTFLASSETFEKRPPSVTIFATQGGKGKQSRPTNVSGTASIK